MNSFTPLQIIALIVVAVNVTLSMKYRLLQRESDTLDLEDTPDGYEDKLANQITFMQTIMPLALDITTFIVVLFYLKSCVV